MTEVSNRVGMTAIVSIVIFLISVITAIQFTDAQRFAAEIRAQEAFEALVLERVKRLELDARVLRLELAVFGADDPGLLPSKELLFGPYDGPIAADGPPP